MYVFLFIALLVLAGAGYYEYNTLQDKVGADDQKVATLTEQISKLEDDKKKLQDSNAKLVKSVNDDQDAIAVLNQQVQTAQQDLNAQAKAPAPVAAAPATATTPVVSSTPSVPKPAGNNLSQISTRDGKSFLSCTLLKFEASGVIVKHSAGITKIAYDQLPDDLQKRFGFDPKLGPGLSPEQVQAQEQLRQSADTAGN